MCGADFEFNGFRCTAPELVWVACYPYNGLAGPGPANGCPGSAPTIGQPCCRAFIAGLPHGCPYDGTFYECTDNHWALRAP